MDEIARLTPTFAGVSYAELDRLAACSGRNAAAPDGTPTMHIEASCAARAASCSPNTCPPTRRSTAAIRCC
jgi:formate dehydrogenase major subunit